MRCRAVAYRSAEASDGQGTDVARRAKVKGLISYQRSSAGTVGERETIADVFSLKSRPCQPDSMIRKTQRFFRFLAVGNEMPGEFLRHPAERFTVHENIIWTTEFPAV